MTDNATDTVKALWRIHDEPRFGSMSMDDIRKRAALLHASDSRTRLVGPGIALFFVAFFAFAFTGHTRSLERAGDAVGLAAGLVMSYRVHRLNLDRPRTHTLALEGADAYRAALVRLRMANDIAWQTMLLVGLSFAISMSATVVAQGAAAALVVALAVALLASIIVAALRYRGFGQRIRRQIEQLDARQE
jgi:hypothetical protein